MSCVVDLFSIGGAVSIRRGQWSVRGLSSVVHEAFDGRLAVFHHLHHVGVEQVDQQVGTQDDDDGGESDSHGLVCCLVLL